jgi:predicted ATPase with chaperone activity
MSPEASGQADGRSINLCRTVVLRVAWTMADLAGRTVPGSDDVAEALGMRLQRVAA